MDEPDPNTFEAIAAEPSRPSGQDDGLLTALRQQRDALASTRDTYVPIQGYGENTGISLWAHYRLLDAIELDAIGRKVAQEFRSNRQQRERILWAGVDAMIEACDGIFYQIQGESEKHIMTIDGVPINGFNVGIARALGFEDKIAPHSPERSIVLGVFGNNVSSVQIHTMLLGRWMANTTIDVTEEFLEAGGNL
jgi:hypothetical protein